MKELMAIIFLLTMAFLALCVSIYSLGQAFNLLFVDNVRIAVMVDGKEVYRGISGCVDTKSLGINTQIMIKGGYLCSFYKKAYVSKDVRVMNA